MWKNIILIVSLALNVFALASFGYYNYQIRSFVAGGERMERRLDRMQERLFERLEGEDRALARRVVGERRPELREGLRELRAARGDVRRALHAETPNAQDLVRALDRSQGAASRLNDTVHGGLRDMATGLSPDALRDLGERMRRRDRDNN